MVTEIELGQTARGFSHGKFKDDNGVECSIQDSSSASASCIWLGVEDANPMMPVEGKGWVPVDYPPMTLFHTRMHVDIKLGKRLLRSLREFIKTGNVKEYKFVDRYGLNCSLQNSSAAERIWLGPDDAAPETCGGEWGLGWRPTKFPPETRFTTRMHLHIEQAQLLVPALVRFIKTGSIEE